MVIIILITAYINDGEDCKKLSLIFNRTTNPAIISRDSPIDAAISIRGLQ